MENGGKGKRRGTSEEATAVSGQGMLAVRAGASGGTAVRGITYRPCHHLPGLCPDSV